jgi:hypothetical protein
VTEIHRCASSIPPAPPDYASVHVRIALATVVPGTSQRCFAQRQVAVATKLPRGTHLCHLYKTQQNLLDTTGRLFQGQAVSQRTVRRGHPRAADRGKGQVHHALQRGRLPLENTSSGHARRRFRVGRRTRFAPLPARGPSTYLHTITEMAGIPLKPRAVPAVGLR